MIEKPNASEFTSKLIHIDAFQKSLDCVRSCYIPYMCIKSAEEASGMTSIGQRFLNLTYF